MVVGGGRSLDLLSDSGCHTLPGGPAPFSPCKFPFLSPYKPGRAEGDFEHAVHECAYGIRPPIARKVREKTKSFPGSAKLSSPLPQIHCRAESVQAVPAKGGGEGAAEVPAQVRGGGHHARRQAAEVLRHQAAPGKTERRKYLLEWEMIARQLSARAGAVLATLRRSWDSPGTAMTRWMICRCTVPA